MSEIFDHREMYQRQYNRLRERIQEVLDSNPDIPAEIADRVRGLLDETNFDTHGLQTRLFNFNQAAWAQELFALISSLDSNEAFTDALIRSERDRKA